VASPFPYPESEKGEKGNKRDSEKNEEEKEIGGSKKKGTEKRAARAVKGGRKGARFTTGRADHSEEEFGCGT